MKCEHHVQARIGEVMWCRNCGAIKLANSPEWQSPATPREPSAVLENTRTQLKSLLTLLDAVLPINEDTKT